VSRLSAIGQAAELLSKLTGACLVMACAGCFISARLSGYGLRQLLYFGAPVSS
jgi:hypothetical protein